jgi:signal transduction histidine kinase/CheY-like chemotaxis protein
MRAMGEPVAHEDGVLSWFTGHGQYMPRIDCLRSEAGGSDWTWIGILITLSIAVVVGYVKIFVFWRRSYLEERPEHRNTKLMQLAWIFAMCAVCGYFAQVVLFFWPGYRLLAFFLLVLNFWTWRFAGNLSELKVSLSAKRLQAELARSLESRNAELEREVESRTAELAEARAQADAASAAKSAFLAHMSHEIRTPLTSVLGYAALAREDGSAAPEVREHLDTVLRNGDHLLAIVNDVLDLSKIEAGELQIERSPIDVRDMVRGIADLLLVRAKEKGIELRVDVAEDVPSCVSSDALRLRQILLNLGSNAIKFTQAGYVGIAVTVRGHMLCVEVSDTGIGMDGEQLARIFRPFSQADARISRRYGGTGLGLALSARIAALIDGGIQVTSSPGKGSTFTLTIDAPQIACHLGECRPTASSDAAPRLTGRRVLLAEDGPDNQRLIATMLRRAGAEVEVASDGREALEKGLGAWRSRRAYDVILMDIQMPEMDGIEATRQLREAGYPGRIVALTAHALDSESEACRGQGFDGYETKPIDREGLIRACLSDVPSGVGG